MTARALLRTSALLLLNYAAPFVVVPATRSIDVSRGQSRALSGQNGGEAFFTAATLARQTYLAEEDPDELLYEIFGEDLSSLRAALASLDDATSVAEAPGGPVLSATEAKQLRDHADALFPPLASMATSAGDDCAVLSGSCGRQRPLGHKHSHLVAAVRAFPPGPQRRHGRAAGA